MSEHDDANGTEQPTSGEAPAELREAHKRATQRLTEVEQENATLSRELAFTKAGINPDDPKMGYFVRGYDGEITADAIRSAATEAGFITDPDEAAKASELAAQQQMDAATAGSGQAPLGEDWQAELANANTQEDVIAIIAKHRPELLPQSQ